MKTCQICGKKSMAGRYIRHKHSGLWERKAPQKTRVFKVNIQKRTVIYKNKKMQAALCTKCIKRIRKDSIYKEYRLPAFKKIEK